MRSEPNDTTLAAPLLFRHSTPRTATVADLPGRYDRDARLWVVDTEAGIVPVIEASPATFYETNTSTRVQHEADDQDPSNTVGLAAVELAGTTVTLVQMEADDQDASTALGHFDALLDTHTLTKVQPEGDDTDISGDVTFAWQRQPSALAELATKTDVQQESDDQMNAGMLELETRTLNNQEGVDESFPAMLLDLQTKTFAEVEGDDDDLSMIH